MSDLNEYHTLGISWGLGHMPKLLESLYLPNILQNKNMTKKYVLQGDKALAITCA
jgi:hypothetical protein